MGISNSLRQLATLAERLEESETEITEFRSRNAAVEGDFEADISLELPLRAGVEGTGVSELSVTDASLTDEGAISIQLTAAIDHEGDEGAPISESSPADIADTAESGVTDGGTAIASDSSSTGVATQDGPIYKDPQRLAAVYDPDRTFSEMRDELGVDVTPKTVRRYMVEHGIHDPDTLSSAGDGEPGDGPAYKDPERLAAVYDPDLTFPEMRDELGVDVTPKTVRHYMVEHGIHDPGSDAGLDPEVGDSGAGDGLADEPSEDESDDRSHSATDEFDHGSGSSGDESEERVDEHDSSVDEPDDEAESPTSETDDGGGSGADENSFLADGEDETLAEDEVAAEIAEDVELPDDLSVHEITEAVCTAKTLYEVQRELGTDREQTHRLLSELNLLELVHGRVSTVSAQSKTREAAERRIREAVTSATR